MRAFHRSVGISLLSVLAGVSLSAGTAAAQPKPAPTPAPAPAGDDGGEIEMGDPPPADGGGDAGGDAGGEIDMGAEPGPSDLSADLAAADAQNTAVKADAVKRTPLSWKDILVVVRKPFLKSGRVELFPMVGTTMNDNMVRHYSVGGQLSYYLTDVLAIGIEGFYYEPSIREPFDLVARQARRLPTVNTYRWSTALDFNYVPVYGKFAVFDRKLVTWEVAFTAGIGVGQSKVEERV
jgi:hypothetical protein